VLGGAWRTKGSWSSSENQAEKGGQKKEHKKNKRGTNDGQDLKKRKSRAQFQERDPNHFKVGSWTRRGRVPRGWKRAADSKTAINHNNGRSR